MGVTKLLYTFYLNFKLSIRNQYSFNEPKYTGPMFDQVVCFHCLRNLPTVKFYEFDKKSIKFSVFCTIPTKMTDKIISLFN